MIEDDIVAINLSGLIVCVVTKDIRLAGFKCVGGQMPKTATGINPLSFLYTYSLTS